MVRSGVQFIFLHRGYFVGIGDLVSVVILVEIVDLDQDRHKAPVATSPHPPVPTPGTRSVPVPYYEVGED